MKKVIVSAIVFAVTSATFAQIGKGSIFAGLDLGFGSGSGETSGTSGGTTTISNKDESSSWNFGPSVQYFVADNFSVGLGFNLSNSKWSQEDPTSKQKWEQVSKGNGIDLFARKYMSVADNFYVFMGLNIGLNGSKGEMEYFDGVATTTKTTSEYSTKSVNLGIGFAWMVTDRFMIQSSFGVLGWNSYNYKYNINAAGDSYGTSKGSDIDFYLSSGNSLFNMGFAYLLNGGS